MKRFLSILLCCIVLACSLGSATAHEGRHAPQIEGRKARRQIRAFLYAKNLRGDKKVIYREYGYTPNRLRVDHGFGEITEIWTYYARGLEFTFDACGRLIERHAIPREDPSVSYF